MKNNMPFLGNVYLPHHFHHFCQKVIDDKSLFFIIFTNTEDVFKCYYPGYKNPVLHLPNGI